MPDFLISNPRIRGPWFPKFAECLFAAISVFNVSLVLIQLLPRNILIHLDQRVFGLILFGQLVIGLIFGLAYSLFWHFREERQAIDSNKLHAWFQAILRYWLA